MDETQRLEGASEAVWRSLLGRKVSVRYRIDDDPEHPYSEAVGVVMSVKSGGSGAMEVTIVNRRGVESTVAIEDVLAGKAWIERSGGR